MSNLYRGFRIFGVIFNPNFQPDFAAVWRRYAEHIKSA